MVSKSHFIIITDDCSCCHDLSTVMTFMGESFSTVAAETISKQTMPVAETAYIACENTIHQDSVAQILAEQCSLILTADESVNYPQPIILHPITAQQLNHLFIHIKNTRQHSRPIPSKPDCLDDIVGQSSVMNDLRNTIRQVAQSDSSVLILGESGTGKELVASSIHQLSERHDNPFVPLNCGAIPAELMESELFGHEKGAFTGAINRRQGRFELANKGSLFLDEIGDMPLPMQVKLLRVLQERCFERIGSNKSLMADVRIIAATHQDLEVAIKDNRFREDLFYRLNVFPIYLSPLRDRVEDLPLLIDHLVQKLSNTAAQGLRFGNDAILLLQHYSWPGNIRELSNLIEQMMVLYPQQTISAEHIPEKYHQTNENTQTAKQQTSLTMPFDPQTLIHARKNLALKDCLLETELSLIIQALDECNGNVTTTARFLEIGRTTLIEKMRKHGIRYSQTNKQDSLSYEEPLN